MNKKYIRQNGVYYSDRETIMKVIKPLFLDDLRNEFEVIKHDKKKLSLFHDKLAELKFLDPANGVGNFLIITYVELCKLEVQVIKNLIKLNCPYNFKVNTGQFYGIDIDKNSCIECVKRMEQTHKYTNSIYESIFKKDVSKERLFIMPKIVHSNALRIDWNDVVPKEKLNYIMGNPPFAGYKYQNKEQKENVKIVFGKKKSLDYVAMWYKKAADYMKNTKIESAFVSTNSISQGEQPAILWEPLMKENNTVINFAHRTFKWDNESKKKKAAVHCVIIGFSDYKNNKEKKIFSSNGNSNIVQNINPYLVDAPSVMIERRNYPVCKVPNIRLGNFPRDGGALLLSKEERENLISNDPIAEKWIRPFIGSDELLNHTKRWCLWLVGANPSELRKCKDVMQRINKVRTFRMQSTRIETQKIANTPTLFSEIRQPSSSYILIPNVSSEKRKYVPMDYVTPNNICYASASFIENANLYHFGVLESSVHMAWMRAVGGRLEMRYRYSGTLVYNNFIWPNTTEKQKEAIKNAAQAVLDARKLFPNSTLADLYDPNTMPPELVKAHEKLDKAVKYAYGKKGFDTEEEIVTSLMKMYKEIVDLEKMNNKKIV